MAKKRILLIDDEEAFSFGAKINLEHTGEYEVRTEADGKCALNVIREFKPDLIFLDIIMPDIDGSEVISRMKSEEDLKDIPVVFLTATITKDEVSSQDGIIGGHPFLAKPVSTKEIIECIRKNIKS